MAHARNGAGIPLLLRSHNQGAVLAARMDKDPQLIPKVGRVLASDEFFRAFSESGDKAKLVTCANLTDLLAAARTTFDGDPQYEQEILRVITLKYLPEYSSGKKSAGNKK